MALLCWQFTSEEATSPRRDILDGSPVAERTEYVVVFDSVIPNAIAIATNELLEKCALSAALAAFMKLALNWAIILMCAGCLRFILISSNQAICPFPQVGQHRGRQTEDIQGSHRSWQSNE